MYIIIKRISDLVLAALALILLMPLMLVLWLWIRIESPGPAIFKQQRAGLNGRPFILFKFRTMRIDVDPYGPSPKTGEDTRLTKSGKFIREYSLDELPQLANIILGSMSLVGPRPLYVSQIAEWSEHHKRRLLAKPGLTGLAQVCGRGELTIEEKLDLDVRYVESAGLLTDLKIICLTFMTVLGRKSIYEKRYSKSQLTRGEK